MEVLPGDAAAAIRRGSSSRSRMSPGPRQAGCRLGDLRARPQASCPLMATAAILHGLQTQNQITQRRAQLVSFRAVLVTSSAGDAAIPLPACDRECHQHSSTACSGDIPQ